MTLPVYLCLVSSNQHSGKKTATEKLPSIQEVGPATSSVSFQAMGQNIVIWLECVIQITRLFLDVLWSIPISMVLYIQMTKFIYDFVINYNRLSVYTSYILLPSLLENRLLPQGNWTLVHCPVSGWTSPHQESTFIWLGNLEVALNRKKHTAWHSLKPNNFLVSQATWNGLAPGEQKTRGTACPLTLPKSKTKESAATSPAGAPAVRNAKAPVPQKGKDPPACTCQAVASLSLEIHEDIQDTKPSKIMQLF